jgi:tricorn protease
MNSPITPKAYLQHPSLHNETIVFATDDDLWSISIFGGEARRLTNSQGLTSSPMISPDGSTIAYLSNDHGQSDIFTIPLTGGIPKRITHVGVSKISGWIDSKSLIYCSNFDTFSPRVSMLHKINLHTEKTIPINLGHSSCLITEGKVRVLGKNIGDPARWKRYRGGTAGTLWVDETGKDNFKQILSKLKSNLANPLIIGARIYFISDHEGIGNIYSCTFKGSGIKRHTHCQTYYVRNFSHHNGKIAFQSGARIHLLDLSTKQVQEIDTSVSSSFNQSTERVENIENYLQEYSLSPNGEKLALISRGKLFTHTPWAKAAVLKGNTDRRYKSPTYYLADDKSDCLIAVELDHENEEKLVLFTDKENKLPQQNPTPLLAKHDWGKIETITAHPEKDIVAITNNRNEMYLLTIKTKKLELIAKNDHRFFESASWSPCGRYLAFSLPTSRTVNSLALYDTKLKKTKVLLKSVLADFSPSFDPTGKYLFFIGMREFQPNYAETHFELSFPFATRPYALILQDDEESPFEKNLGHDFSGDDEDESEEKEKEKEKPKKVSSAKKTKKTKKKATKTKAQPESDDIIIDWEGIEQRIVPFPVSLGGYSEIKAVENKVFFLKSNISGIDPFSSWMDQAGPGDLFTYCFKENKKEVFQKECSGFQISLDEKYIVMDCDEGLRLVQTESKPTDGDDFNKKDGHLDLSQIKLSVDPKKEWRQMYQEAWILQREHFWVKDMNKINWISVFKNYLPVLERVNTRKEFSDLIWEMQGELGTSHCYEFGGSYKRRPRYEVNGQLAAKTTWNESDKSYQISSLASGDSWIPRAANPLTKPGVSLRNGDRICGIDGRMFEQSGDLERALVARANKKTNFIVKRKQSKDYEQVDITPTGSAHLARYRDWVEKNREYVHKKSKGKLGYVHIPDMSIHGFSEFWRGFLSECTKEGLVVDVRYNGGGNVSQHVLKILAQKIQGFDKTRYMGIEPYPMYAINGPIVGITNEHAGSDGDIFSHTFKLMKIGPLIGKRTWGGVVGIWPRHSLNYGSLTTQPEFSFWFKDVGYDVENYGTDPDIEVEIMPKDWKENKDPQLDRAISEAQKMAKKNPPLKPNLNSNRPNLSAPKLPKL